MKKNEKRVLKTVSVRDAVFVYTSLCCGLPAEKPACSVAKGQRIGVFPGAKPEGEATLGGWRCTGCRKPCSVSRSKNVKSTQEMANV